ncbi:hypothetical protein CLV58_109223 [Spirosoma oryzae]|uniref:Uncharacterized protein n=1 Tax=Spirosoma oryzae TaxID=1469603 RepID=A0A2T0SYK7_9BACT|nr:hypothetical protein [Spirosoma oryzae]PRY38496.1 hypothetical protein CLV58_109223 [Spirosoma oryzae]
MKDYYSTSLSTLRSRAWASIEDSLQNGPIELISEEAQELYKKGDETLFEDERLDQPTIEVHGNLGNTQYMNIVALRLKKVKNQGIIYCTAYNPENEKFGDYELRGRMDDTELMDLADLLTQRSLSNANV